MNRAITDSSMHSDLEIPVRLLSHNIRYATDAPSKGEEPWSVRKHGLVNELRFSTAHNAESFICLQEVLHVQLHDICSGLNEQSVFSTTGGDRSRWAYIGVGRDDGQEAGEYSPIFYRPSVWELLDFRTVWLSKTPSQPSKSWDAVCIRIVTIGVFKHRASKMTLLALNTHLDDQGAESRVEAAKIILQQIDDYTTGQWKDNIRGVFFAGDLNSMPGGQAYRLFNGSTSSVKDLRDAVPSHRRYGHESTFSGFGNVAEQRIDFIHLGPRNREATGGTNMHLPWKVEGYGVLENRFDDGVYISDHRAVVADVVLT